MIETKPFRDSFFAERRRLVSELGPDAFDQAAVLYVCRNTGQQIVVRDAFPAPVHVAVTTFAARLHAEWWAARQSFGGDAEPGSDFAAVAGLYARYLPEVGFDWALEFGEHGVFRAWRVDGRGEATQLEVPSDETTFRDQTGTFFDLQAAWREMVTRFTLTGELAVAEVQSGYIIGVREGVPDDPDPAGREDEELMSHFSRWDTRDYDTLEFINGPDSEDLPLGGGRWHEWLGVEEDAARAGRIELFALADSTAFVACVADLAAPRDVRVQVTDDDQLRLSKGPLRMELDLARPYLRTVHGGRSFAQGARAFFLPALVALDEAADLLAHLRAQVSGHDVRVERGTVLVIQAPGAAEPVGRWNLLGLVGRQTAHGTEGIAELMAFLGYDPETREFSRTETQLDRCPVCGQDARVGKVIRPQSLLGIDPRTLAGVLIGPHVVFYTLECPDHVTPLEPHPDRTLAVLESTYRDGLADAPLSLIAVTAWEDGALIVGFDAGSLVLEPARIRAALAAGEISIGDDVGAYAFGPDALLVVPGKLEGTDLHRGRIAADDATRQRFPGRDWPLDVVRSVELDVEPQGRVQWVE